MLPPSLSSGPIELFMAYISGMGFIFSFLPLIAVGGFTVILGLASKKPELKALLILSSPILATIYTSFQGKNILSMASQGSVAERIKFIVIFAGPILIGTFGYLNERDNQRNRTTRISNRKILVFSTLIAFPVLQGFSIIALRPVNGVGQSVYVPFFAFIFTLVGVILSSWKKIKLKDFTRGGEIFLFVLYSFLFTNQFIEIIKWHVGSTLFLSEQTDGFRYSPFGSFLGLSGRNSFMENDPEIFALVSLMAFAVLIQSTNRFFSFLGSFLVFVIGSTTQSRVFYIGMIVIVILKLSNKYFPKVKVQVRVLYFISVFFAYILVILQYQSGPETSGITNFSGRVYIWKIVLQHWDDSGKLFGHFGAYSLYNFCQEFGARFDFYHAHSLPLQTLWDWGIFGLFLMVGILILLTFISLKLSEAGFLLLAAITLAGIIEPTLNTSILSSLFFFVLLLYKNIFEYIDSLSESSQ